MRFWICCLIMTVGIGSLSAQKTYTLSPESQCKINGTSTISDWTVEVMEMRGTVQLGKDFTGRRGVQKNAQAQSGMLRIPVKKIKSANGETMDANIYEAFDAPNHPHIEFDLESARVMNLTDAGFRILFTGQLKMAGQSRPVEIQMDGKKTGNQSYQFIGSHKINMLDYKMEPPTAMFGAIEAGEEVELLFDLIFTES